MVNIVKGFQRSHHLIVKPAFLDALSAVVQQDFFSVRLESFADLLVGIATEDQLGRRGELEIQHVSILFPVDAYFLAQENSSI